MSKRMPTTSKLFRKILGRTMAGSGATMPKTVAREVLRFGFSPADRVRLADLMKRKEAGSLPPADKAELDEFAVAATFLSLFKAQARIALKRVGRAKAEA